MMKYQGIIIAIIASIALIVSVMLFNSQKQRDTDVIINSQEQQKTQSQENIQKCITVGSAKVEEDACKSYGMTSPCNIPSSGQSGVNKGVSFVIDYCQKTYGK